MEDYRNKIPWGRLAMLVLCIQTVTMLKTNAFIVAHTMNMSKQ